MKKVLIEGMSDTLGGVETFVHTLYLALKDECEIDFITINDSVVFQDEFEKNGSRIFHITPRYKSVKRFKSDIDRVFRENQYDVFWFNKTSLSAVDSMRLAKKYGVPKVICHGHTSKNMGSAFTYVMHKMHSKQIDKFVDLKIACSDSAAKYFFGDKAKDAKIFLNAVDTSKYNPNEEKQKEIKKKLGLEGQYIIGHAGRFAEVKNHKFLLDVFQKYLEREDAHLILCGTGELLEEIKKLAAEKNISDKVSFLGVRNDMADIFQAMDLMVLPSLFEGLPFVVVEAQAAGVPCIVSDTVGKESKLTDILEFVSLEDGPEEWVETMLKYRNYKKVSKEDMIRDKGFTLDCFEAEARKIVLD